MAALYTIWHALYMSFYSKALYLDVGRGWRGTGMLYVALISAFCVAILVGSWLSVISTVDLAPEAEALPGETEKKQDLNSILVQLIAQVPAITIKKGQASIEQPEPYTIYYPKNNKPFAIIDTKGTHTSLDNSDAMILVTKEKLIYKTAENEVQSTEIAKLSPEDRVVDAYTVTEWVKQGKKMLLWALPLLVFPILTVVSFVYLAVRALIFGVVGMLIGSALKVEEMTYQDYMRLASVASTPVALIYLAIMLFPPLGAIPLLNPLIFAVGVGYMYLAVKATR